MSPPPQVETKVVSHTNTAANNDRLINHMKDNQLASEGAMTYYDPLRMSTPRWQQQLNKPKQAPSVLPNGVQSPTRVRSSVPARRSSQQYND